LDLLDRRLVGLRHVVLPPPSRSALPAISGRRGGNLPQAKCGWSTSAAFLKFGM
jgi:hypothetical protein